jgi:hypothetical protein
MYMTVIGKTKANHCIVDEQSGVISNLEKSPPADVKNLKTE